LKAEPASSLKKITLAINMLIVFGLLFMLARRRVFATRKASPPQKPRQVEGGKIRKTKR
jgi:hypothetical protein